MKILVVCQNYYPEQFRITDICEELVKRGHEVSVVTGLPNYPKGKIFEGYKGGKRRNEVINGVKVHRCFTIGRRHSVFFRFLNYYSFAVSSNKYIRRLKEDFDVVFVNQLSPIMMANAAITYKIKHNKKLILYCLDLWPESLVAGGVKVNSFLYNHYKKVSAKIYKRANKIFVTSKSFVRYFAEKFEITDTDYLPQYAEDIFSVEECKKEPNDYVDLMFAGNIGAAQGVNTIIEAAKLTQNINNLRWHIVGNGSELNNAKSLAKDLSNVFFYGEQALDKMPKFYSMADAMLVVLKKDPTLSYTLPGKVQTYMAAGKPIIGAIDGEAKRVIDESYCGYSGEAENPQALADNVIRFIKSQDKDKLADNAIKYYKENFSKEKFFNLLLQTLEVNSN